MSEQSKSLIEEAMKALYQANELLGESLKHINQLIKHPNTVNRAQDVVKAKAFLTGQEVNPMNQIDRDILKREEG